MSTRAGGFDRGVATAVEAALIIPALVGFVALVIWLAATALADQAVTAAAQHGARAASLERSASDARRAATAAVSGALADAGVQCSEQTLAIDVSELAAPLGRPAEVRVHLACVVVNRVALPGFPTASRVEGTGRSPIDTFRSR